MGYTGRHRKVSSLKIAKRNIAMIAAFAGIATAGSVPAAGAAPMPGVGSIVQDVVDGTFNTDMAPAAVANTVVRPAAGELTSGYGPRWGRMHNGIDIANAVGTPIYAFLFLVALGIDYTVFLVLRAREETAEHGTVGGMVQAVGLTGGVITSAGIVLAAVFAVLGVLPLITLTQVGLIVGLGILLDTFLVRTVVVPAVFALAGDKIWWPSSVTRDSTDTTDREEVTA